MNKNYDDLIGVEYKTMPVIRQVEGDLHEKYEGKTGYIKKITLDNYGKPSLCFGVDGSSFTPDFVQVYYNQKELCNINEWHEKSNQLPNYFIVGKKARYSLHAFDYEIVDAVYYSDQMVVKCKKIRSKLDDMLFYDNTTKSFSAKEILVEIDGEYLPLNEVLYEVSVGLRHE